MFALIAQISSFFTSPAQTQNGVANQLMERAEARVGLNPHQAEELRSAARAYLSVVR